MPGDDIRFYGTTGPAGTFDGDAESDPDEYLGRFRSSTLLHEFQSSLTANQTTQTRHIVVDSARIGDGADVHALKWLLMATGTNALSAARIMAFDTATGTFKLDRRLGPGNAIFGHEYTVFPRNNVCPDVTPAQAAAGDTRFRCIVMRNEHGAIFTNFRVYFVPLMTSGVEFASITQAENPTGTSFISRDDDVTDILDSLGQRFTNPSLPLEDQFRSSSTWWRALADAQAVFPVSPVVPLDIGLNFSVGIWLRRTIPSGMRFRRSVAFMLIAISDVGGSSPDPLAGAALLSFDIEGLAPTPTLTVDRFVSISGGARLLGNVQANGSPLVDRPVKFQVKPGDQGVIVAADDPAPGYDRTDANGDVFATFFAPTNPAFEGDLSHPQLIVGDGEEVGNP